MKYLPGGKSDNLDTNTKKVIRWTLLVIIVFFGGFLLWAGLAPLHSGIVSPGVVQTSTHVQIIQSPLTANISKILIKDGDAVKKGQLLVLLDDSQAKAMLSKYENEYYYLLALKARLEAQISGSNKINFPQALLDKADNPTVANLMQTQTQLFYSTMQNIQTQINALSDNTAGLQAQKNGLLLSKEAMKSQLQIIGEQLNSLKEITKEGYYPKNQYLDKQRQYEDLKANYENVVGQINHIDAQILENQAKIQNLKSQFSADTQSELSKAIAQMQSAKDQYSAAKIMYDNCFIKSPVDGEVLYLSYHTIGAVVGQGQEIMQILPKDSKFIIETQVQPQDIAKVHKGSEASLFFAALNIHTTPEVKGKVIYVSPDVLTNPQTKMSYYVVRVELTKEAIKELAHKDIKPGMPVEVKFRAGAKTMLQYLLNPLTENFHKAFTE
jgi:protease secretion system membrane fusion protein